MFEKADLHIHTTNSDGDLTPSEIIEYAKYINVDVIAITDHNTTQGVDEAIEKGREKNILVIPGIELSTRYKGKKVHVLGYFRDFRYKDEKFLKALYYLKRKDDKGLKCLFKGSFDIEVKKGRLSIKSGIDILKYFGAKVVLAHPVLIEKEYLREILEYKFDGLEAKYYRNTVRDTKVFMKLCKKKKLLYTAGSDFHTNKTIDFNHGLLGEVYLDKKEIGRFLKKLKLSKEIKIKK